MICINCKVGICHYDFYYAVSLMEYFNSHEEVRINAVVFSGIPSVKEYLDSNVLHVLLVDSHSELLTETELIKEKHISVLALSEEKNASDETGRVIFKYQPAREIGKQIKLSLPGKIKLQKGETIFLGVYSPLGRSGKTTLAEGLCNFKPNALYVGFEEFSGWRSTDNDNKINGNSSYTASCFLYYLADKNPDILKLLCTIKDKGEKGIIGIKSYMDIRQINQEHMGWFKTILKGQGIYDMVVFDFGTGALSDFSILCHMDRILVPILEDRISMCKIKNFEALMKEHGMDVAEKKVRYVHVLEKSLSEDDYEYLLT